MANVRTTTCTCPCPDLIFCLHHNCFIYLSLSLSLCISHTDSYSGLSVDLPLKIFFSFLFESLRQLFSLVIDLLRLSLLDFNLFYIWNVRGVSKSLYIYNLYTFLVKLSHIRMFVCMNVKISVIIKARYSYTKIDI